ncbi:carbohydrate kinase family protein [Nigerium massiliense]|uniref:carbohydrate kinase family protein n=1 Tax=Nigerium massiliense TaxID=1522317 RepID=UPI00058B787A|nr:carbohydrate kinase [Nigerium massiliense]
MADGTVLALGEALIDAVHQDDEVTEIVGGSLLNVACGLSALGHEARIGCWIGQDDRGRRIVDYARERAVEIVEGCDRAGRTPVAYAQIDDQGKATYTFDLEWDLPPIADLDGYAHVHTGSIGATLEPGGTKVVQALDAARSATVSYDPNVRPALMGSPADVVGRIEEIVARADVVKASDEDLAWLYPGRGYADVLRDWATRGPRVLLTTRGAEGAAVVIAGEDELHELSAPSVAVRDTVGAGDSFMAGLISGLLDAGLLGGPDAREALKAATWDDVAPAVDRALATSAITVGRAGAYGPSRDEVGRTQAEKQA